MSNCNASVPAYPGLTWLGTQQIYFSDHRCGKHAVFPVHHYRNDTSGELVLVAEDRFEAILDQMIALGAFASNGGVA